MYFFILDLSHKALLGLAVVEQGIHVRASVDSTSEGDYIGYILLLNLASRPDEQMNLALQINMILKLIVYLSHPWKVPIALGLYCTYPYPCTTRVKQRGVAALALLSIVYTYIVMSIRPVRLLSTNRKDYYRSFANVFHYHMTRRTYYII